MWAYKDEHIFYGILVPLVAYECQKLSLSPANAYHLAYGTTDAGIPPERLASDRGFNPTDIC